LTVNRGGSSAAVASTNQAPGSASRSFRHTWLLLYVGMLVIPLVLVAAGRRDAPRTFVHELGSGLGIVVLVVLAMQLVLPSRLRLLAPLGADVAIRLHRRLATLVLTLTAAHVVAIVLADPARLALFRFVDAPLRAQAAIGAVVAMLVLFGTSVARRRVRLSYMAWRGVHLVLGCGALALAIVHTTGVHRYLVEGPGLAALATLVVVPVGSLAALRIARLRRATVMPYVVVGTRPEGGGVTTLQLRAEDHEGQVFEPGQFAWIRLADRRSAIDEHPFSYASSARRPRDPSFAIRARDGFTARVPAFDPGTRVLVDGPHGPFRQQPWTSGMLLVAGGIGITPALSILRTAWDDGATSAFVLVYAGRSLDSLTFLDELDLMRLRLDLDVVPVLSDPPPDWTGERGRLGAEVLDRHLPDDVRRWQFTVCGPPGLVATTFAPLAQRGIPHERVHAEQFVEV
jgi:predicted ferric reductase